MKNNFGILISNNPQSWGLDVENGGRGNKNRTKEGDEEEKTIIHSFNKYLLSVYLVQILGTLSYPAFHVTQVDSCLDLDHGHCYVFLGCVY